MQSGLYTAGCRDWEDVRCGSKSAETTARLNGRRTVFVTFLRVRGMNDYEPTLVAGRCV